MYLDCMTGEKFSSKEEVFEDIINNLEEEELQMALYKIPMNKILKNITQELWEEIIDYASEDYYSANIEEIEDEEEE